MSASETAYAQLSVSENQGERLEEQTEDPAEPRCSTCRRCCQNCCKRCCQLCCEGTTWRDWIWHVCDGSNLASDMAGCIVYLWTPLEQEVCHEWFLYITQFLILSATIEASCYMCNAIVYTFGRMRSDRRWLIAAMGTIVIIRCIHFVWLCGWCVVALIVYSDNSVPKSTCYPEIAQRYTLLTWITVHLFYIVAALRLSIIRPDTPLMNGVDFCCQFRTGVWYACFRLRHGRRRPMPSQEDMLLHYRRSHNERGLNEALLASENEQLERAIQASMNIAPATDARPT